MTPPPSALSAFEPLPDSEDADVAREVAESIEKLSRDGLIEPAGEGRHRITPEGTRYLEALKEEQDRDAGPPGLDEARWRAIEQSVPVARPGRQKYDRRLVVTGIVWKLLQGLPWSGLPTGFPPGPVLAHYYSAWRRNGAWGRILDALEGTYPEPAETAPDEAGEEMDAHAERADPSA